MEFENKEQVAVFIERHLKELGGEAYGLPYIAEKLWQWHEQQVKSVDLADVGERYLAIGTLASGKSFRYEDNAVDMRAFANYINEIYPDFEVDAIIAT